MRRERYIFNKQTLRYEKVVEPLSTTLLRIFGFVCAAVFTAFIFTILAHQYFPSPNEKALRDRVERLEAYIENEVGEDLALMEASLNNLQKRDAYAHRMIFGMNPIDENIWEGGIGGHDAYAEFDAFGASGDLMAGIQGRIDQLKYQMSLQSRSLDTILLEAQNKEDMLASIPSIKPVRGDHLRRGMNLLSGFGMRIHPVYKVPRMHNGIDFTAPRGTSIQATGNGRVIQAGRAGGFGLRVVIDHGYGYTTTYGHMSRIDVKVGQEVTRGEPIGLVGNTGTSTAPHCHYEVHLNGRPINPVQFVTDGLTPEEYQQLVEAAESVNQSFD
ncbi:MAG: M23 family metallopeptidase [Lewinella sp.]|nr:M23 family metallopeptidase [Lewinella sp.]